MPTPPDASVDPAPRATAAPAAEVARRLEHEQLETLYRLSQMRDEPEQAIKDFALEAAVAMTRSAIGHLYFLEESERTLTLHAWSRDVMAECCVATKSTVYRVEETGLWGEAVRQRRPQITNDYAAPHPAKRGTPEGHVAIRRHMCVPLEEGGRIVLLAGVGNKAEPYDERDVHHLTLVMEAMWSVLQRRRSGEQLARAQRLESLALLAGGIAHDFNNLLTGILGNLSLARLEAAEPGVQELLDEAEAAGRRARELTVQLLTFSKGGAPVRKVVDLRPVVSDAARFVLHGTRAALELQLDPELLPVEADAGQIGQVVHNVVLNAAQAMSRGGKVTIRAANEQLAPGNVAGLPPGAYVRIAIEDQGPGIPPDVASRIFEPYFTTKPKGTGLGLAVCHSIIRKHGGAIDVVNHVGAGARFEVLLPATHQRVPEPKPPSAVAAALPVRSILVLDDEAPVRRVVERVLRSRGVAVTGAADGAEALALWREAHARGEPFDVVIADLTVPGGMGGRELLARLRELDAGVRVVVSSGYADDPGMADHRALGFVGVLPKPWSADDLVRAVRDAAAPHD